MYAPIILLGLLASFGAATPVRRQNGQCPAFAEQDYSQFQISDGVGGDALAEAEAIVAPLANCDLATVNSASLSAIKNMRSAAESAETDEFNPAIDAASGATSDALDVGKTKNKVLKHVLFMKILEIEAAQGANNADKIADRETKLNNNSNKDVSNAGKASQGVA